MSLRASVRRLGVVAVVCAVLVVAGCGGDEPTPEPKLPAEKTSSPEPEPEEELTDEESVEAFVREWNDELTRMQVSGDVEAFAGMSDQCEACDGVVETVRSAYSRGGSIQTEGWEIDNVEISRHPNGRLFNVDMAVVVAPTILVKEKGALPERIGGEETKVSLSVVRVDGSWKVRNIGEYA